MASKLIKTVALTALVALSAVAGFAQTTTQTPTQTQTTTPFGRRMGRKMGGKNADKNPMREERAERRALRDLNMTDAQRQQMRDIERRYAQPLRGDREELRKLMETRRSGGTLTAEQQARARQLRQELRANAERLRGEVQNLLTPEQRLQLQQRREQMRQGREQRRKEMTLPPGGNANNEQ